MTDDAAEEKVCKGCGEVHPILFNTEQEVEHEAAIFNHTCRVTASMLHVAIQDINDELGEGFAQEHPSLVAAMINAMTVNYQTISAHHKRWNKKLGN